MNLNTFCPGVYTSVKKTAKDSSLGAVCIAARSQGGNTGEILTLYSISAAVSAFSEPTLDAPLSALVSTAINNGAKKVYAVRCEASSDYSAAFDEFCELSDVAAVMCDSCDQDVLTLLDASIQKAVENGRERFAVMKVSADNITAPRNLRNVFVSQPSEYMDQSSEHITAAAVAGQICKSVYSGKNINSNEFMGITLADSITYETADALLSCGITPIGVLGRCANTRCISSFTEKGIRDIYSVITCDTVIKGARRVLTDLFDSPFEPTYSAIENRLIVFLEQAVDNRLISRYERPVLSQNETDPTVCDILLSFTSAVGINQIRLFAEVSI